MTPDQERSAAARHRLHLRQMKTIYRWARSPVVEFMETGAAGGIVLMASMLAALIWANSPWSATYHHVWHSHLTLEVGPIFLDLSIAHWINDGLMAVFFFLVGLEIKRELLSGELSSPRQALLPVMAAIGGMAVPALVYVAFNAGGPEARGWGVPMATDIAFALGVLALLGKRVPLGLKIFLTALAIVDDIGAVLVIAFFYTTEISLWHLWMGLSLTAGLFVLNQLNVRRAFVYVTVGIVIWYMFYKSGVHATIAGVLVALTVPHRILYNREGFQRRVKVALAALDETDQTHDEHLEMEQRGMVMQIIHDAAERWGSPLHRLEHDLGPYVAFGIVPLFALANAGVHLDVAGFGAIFTSTVSLGILAGLVAGKVVGVVLFSWLAVRLGARLPIGADWRSVVGVSALAGIGFTMSLFIANLAFETPEALDVAKLGILAASLVAGLLGTLILTVGRPAPPEREPVTEAEALGQG